MVLVSNYMNRKGTSSTWLKINDAQVQENNGLTCYRYLYIIFTKNCY